MRLNAIQRRIILVGILMIILMGLFPPWKYTFQSSISHSEEPAGYRFIASPPSRRVSNSMHGVKIDATRLLIQWAMTILASVFGVLVAQNRKDEQNS